MTHPMIEEGLSVPMLAPDIEGSTPSDDPAEPVRRRRRRRLFLRLLLALLALIVLVGASLLVRAQTLGRVIPGQALIDKGAAVTKPGNARSVGDQVEINGSLRYRPAGEFLFTTVSVDLDVSVFDWIQAEANDDFELVPVEHILGDRTPQENRTRNIEMMNRSKDDAIIAALEYLGAPVNETGVGFNIVVSDGPVDGLLTVEDVIIAVDAVEITSLESLRAELARKTVGETGGPSAGLAFALTIIDWLTEGELTGNQRIAVTGQIFVGGVVGNVGGVGHKAVAARSAGAVAFIVPKDLVADAQAQAEDMRVFGVSTLDEAIDALAELGGDTSDLRLDFDVS